MSTPLSYPRNGSQARSYQQHPSMNSTESAPSYGSTRMGPPSSEYPPQVLEIDPSSSRTLPSPSASAPVAWDSSTFPPHGFGEMSTYGPSNMSRQLPVENHSRGTAQDPLLHWYIGNDGPWIPRGISEVPTEQRHRTRQGNRIPLHYPNQYRQPIPSDAGTHPYAAPHSDSGYGGTARRSDGNASVFSADVPDRDQDFQSIAGPAPDFHYPGMNEVLQPRDPRSNDWTAQMSNTPMSDSSSREALVCSTCHKTVKTRSELKKHDLRHRKPFTCNFPGCQRDEGFSTSNDLDRHTKSKHPSAAAISSRYRCRVQGCKSKEKSWPRLDNFRSHLKRVHKVEDDEQFEETIRRSEYMEAVGPTPTQEDFFARRPSLPHPRTVMAPVNSQPRPQVMEPSVQSIWRPIYPEVIESSQDLLAPKDSPLENVNKTAAPEDTTPSYDTPPRETIQPQEIFRGPPKISDSRPQLNNILAAPVSLKEVDPKKAEASPNPVAHPPKVSPQGKATRHTVFTTDAKITEVIKSALVGISITDDGRGMHYDRSNLPNGKSSPGTQSGSDPAASPGSDINSPDSPCSEAFRDSEAQRKAQEVLKTLHDLGYIVQKDPAHTPKPRNPGSAASSKSEHLVTCQKCGKFTGRPCELKKHMKRHSRPYGCTFLTCNKTFGSKNDWKRHENSQHYHLETWRCDEEKPEGGACAKVCYRRQTFTDHLKKDHSVTDAEVLKTKVEACRIGRNCQARFWCGFCIKLIDLKNKGLDAWTERFDHIDDHFMGRHDFAKQSIQDWIPIDNSEKPKGDVALPHDLDSSAGKEGQEELSGSPASSSNASSPESPGVAGESSAHAINLEDRQEGQKRKRSSSSDNMRPAKQPRKAHGEKVVFCCHCHGMNNPKLDKSCNSCNNHDLCDSCPVEYVPQDERHMDQVSGDLS